MSQHTRRVVRTSGHWTTILAAALGLALGLPFATGCGTGDDNVHYQGTERLINELVKHNKPFEMLAYPNRQHGIRRGEGTELHLHSTMTRYFEQHLKTRAPN